MLVPTFSAINTLSMFKSIIDVNNFAAITTLDEFLFPAIVTVYFIVESVFDTEVSSWEDFIALRTSEESLFDASRTNQDFFTIVESEGVSFFLLILETGIARPALVSFFHRGKSWFAIGMKRTTTVDMLGIIIVFGLIEISNQLFLELIIEKIIIAFITIDGKRNVPILILMNGFPIIIADFLSDLLELAN